MYPVAPSNPKPKPKKRTPIAKKASEVRNGLYGEGTPTLLDNKYKTTPMKTETHATTRT